jgi:hypothetical protein
VIDATHLFLQVSGVSPASETFYQVITSSPFSRPGWIKVGHYEPGSLFHSARRLAGSGRLKTARGEAADGSKHLSETNIRG